MSNLKSLFLIVFIGTVIFCAPVYAAQSAAERQTVFNNLTDYLATVGKSSEDKKEALQDRRDTRRETRMKNEARRKQSQTRKRMKAQEQAIMKKIHAQ